MCKCLIKIEKETLKLLEKKFVGTGKIEQNNGLDIAFGTTGSRTYTNYSYKNTTIKKDGSFGATFKREQMIVHSFCPFCGEKYPETK